MRPSHPKHIRLAVELPQFSVPEQRKVEAHNPHPQREAPRQCSPSPLLVAHHGIDNLISCCHEHATEARIADVFHRNPPTPQNLILLILALQKSPEPLNIGLRGFQILFPLKSGALI